MPGLFTFLISVWISYLFFLFMNDPIDEPKARKTRLPNIRFKNIEILPSFRIHAGSRTFHFHHWLLLSIGTIGALILFENLQHHIVLNGAAVGGIIQGLRYPDRFQFKHPRNTEKRLR